MDLRNQQESTDLGFLKPIAKEGEQQFACILRNRSGIDAGSIDMGLRDISDLSEIDQQDAVEAAFTIYSRYCEQTGKKSKRDSNS